MYTETHLYTSDEITNLIAQAENRSPNTELASMFAQIASAKAMAEIAYQLERLNALLGNAVDKNGCVLVREWDMD